jgi:outer membrane protein OmpA-like peptidoglycan-associated protein
MLRVPVALLVVVAPAIAAADPIELGPFLGPRIFSQKSALGYIDGETAHPMLENGVTFGARVARQFGLPWLYPEFELAFCPTKTTTPMGAIPADIYWLDPRVQVRFELLPGRRLQPFLLVGGGAPIAISSARKTLNSGVIGEGYAGGGVRFDTQKGFTMRADARIAIIPGENPPLIGAEVEINIGVELHLGEHHVKTPEVVVEKPPDLDTDGDGIPDVRDKCPDRPEDKDGFEDADGCPDIDNDGDHVLDIADKCPNEPETVNGFEDEDGCPDTVPPDVAALKGTIEGLIYADGETAVRDSAQPALKKIAKLMADHPGIRVVLVGHTDNQEAKAFVTPPAKGQPPPDVDSIATQLAHGRAEAVRQALVAVGVAQGRIVVDGVGAEEPVADDSTAKGRLANRRVEIKLYVPH